DPHWQINGDGEAAALAEHGQGNYATLAARRRWDGLANERDDGLKLTYRPRLREPLDGLSEFQLVRQPAEEGVPASLHLRSPLQANGDVPRALARPLRHFLDAERPTWGAKLRRLHQVQCGTFPTVIATDICQRRYLGRRYFPEREAPVEPRGDNLWRVLRS